VGERGVDAGLFPRFLDQRVADGRARRDAAADQVVEQPRIDRLGRAPPRDPHRRALGGLDQPVHVDGSRADAEIARRGPLEHADHRMRVARAHVVALVAPRRQRAFGGERARDACKRRSTRLERVARRRETKSAVGELESLVERRHASRTFDGELADAVAVRVERDQHDGRRRQRGREARMQRG
jgi:hypothetical protein